MASTSRLSNEADTVTIEFPDLNNASRTIQNWNSYSISHKFQEPCATFTMEIGDERIPDVLIDELRPGLKVVFRINGATQFTGFLDAVDVECTREGGTKAYLEGRDCMGPVVDACADPSIVVTEKSKLNDVLRRFMAPFGFTNFEIDNSDNVAIIQGHFTGKRIKSPKGSGGKRRRRSRRRKKKKLDTYGLSILKPKPGEGTYQFLQRLCQREGLYLWAGADGETAYASSPDVYADPEYTLRLTKDGRGNILQSKCRRDWKDQPSVVFAGASAPGGTYPRSKMKRYIVNPYIGFGRDRFATDQVALAIAANPDSVQILTQMQEAQVQTLAPSGIARPCFLTVVDAQQPQHVEFFLRRFLCDKIRKVLVYTATVRGHTHDGGAWAIDSLVTVDDERTRVQENLYIIGKTFTKTRHGGSLTSLEMVRPEAMNWLSDQDYEQDDGSPVKAKAPPKVKPLPYDPFKFNKGTGGK